MSTFDDVAQVIVRNRARFEKPGVISVRPGYQSAGGWLTKKVCIVVNVRSKGDFTAGDALPENVEGFAVDVRQAAVQQIAAVDGLPVSARPEHALPTFAGEVQIAPVAAGAPAPVRATPKATVQYSGPDDASLDRVEDVMSITCHASPDAGWPTLEGFLQGTQKTLVVGLYDFTSGHILQTVTEVFKTSGELSLVLDHPAPNPSRDQTDDQTYDALEQTLRNRLSFAWALERNNPRVIQWIFPNAYHIKVAVRDSRAFWLSSGNWNNSNQPDVDPVKDPDDAGPVLSRADRDWHLIVEHPGLARMFEAYILHDLTVAAAGQTEAGPEGIEPEGVEPPDVDATVPRTFFPPLSIQSERVAVQPLLTPDNYLDHVLRLIQGAETSLHIQTQYIHPSDKDEDRRLMLLLETLQQKIEKGVDVRIICSQYETDTWLEKLQEAGIDLRVVKIQNRVHNKGIVVDGKVVMVSSQNWSADGVLRNRDAGLIVWHEKAAKYFSDIFNHDWVKLAKQQVAEMRPAVSARVRTAVRTKVPTQITVNGITVDPVRQAPALLSAALIRSDASSSDYVLVQTDAPLTPDHRKALEDAGAQVLELVPGNAYVCHYPPTDLTPLRALPFVKFANPYFGQFKLAPGLRGLGATPAVDMLSLSPLSPPLSRQPQEVDVVLHRNVDPSTVRDKIAQAAGINPDQLKMGRGKVRLLVEPSHLQALAALDEVRHIEEFKAPKLMNDTAARLLERSFAAYEGDSESIAICDTGIDDTHPAFTGRIVAKYALGRPGVSDDPHGHGTHVAGSALGAGSYAPGPAAAPIAVYGMAPKAKLVMQSVLGPRGGLTGLPADLHDLFEQPYNEHSVRIHSNSWGSAANGEYTSSCHEVDDFVWNNRDCVVVFAAGNDGADFDSDGRIDPGSIGSPGTAKNCITVGATESLRPEVRLRYGQGWPDRFPVDPIASDYVADKPQGMAAFSSRGPTRDGRIKPDVVAPGTCILSTRSSAAQPVDAFGVSADPRFMFDSGTSMATPLVSGCIAALRQAVVQQHGLAKPSAALLKALLVNGAAPVKGQYATSEVSAIPNSVCGFGMVSMARTLPPYGGAHVQLQDERDALSTGESRTIVVKATAGKAKVTLVWTDLPGETLQNDLDLIVVDDQGREYHGNLGISPDFDRANNVEQVELDCRPGAEIRVVVRAYRTLEPQPYALVTRFVPPSGG